MKEFTSHDAILAKQVMFNSGMKHDPDSQFVKSIGPANPETPEDQDRVIVVGFTLNDIPLECNAHYTRMQIEDVLTSVNVPRLVIRGDQPTRAAVIELLREQLNINIVEADVLEVEPPEDHFFIHGLEFGADPDSKLYQGALNATCLVPFPDQVGLILVSAPGVEIVEPEPREPEQFRNNPLSKAELRPNGQLIRKGAGPNGGFTCLSDGGLSLSLTARYPGDDTLPPLTDNPEDPINKSIYVLDKPVGQAWMSVFSMALEGGGVLTDAYDIYLNLTANVEGGKSAFWKLTRNGNRLEFVGEEGAIAEISGSLSVCQGILDPKALASTLGYVDPTGSGMYVIQLAAYRKNAVVEPFKAMIMVDRRPAIAEQQEEQSE